MLATYQFAPCSKASRIAEEPKLYLCRKCDKLLPLHKFKANVEVRLCHEHLKEMHRLYKRHLPIRVVNCLRTKAHVDMTVFNAKKINLKNSDILKMLGPEHMSNMSHYSMVPRRPDKEITVDNVAIITSAQRRYLIATWKINKDADEYESNLKNLLEHHNAVSK
jgi:hypothetical protein